MIKKYWYLFVIGFLVFFLFVLNPVKNANKIIEKLNEEISVLQKDIKKSEKKVNVVTGENIILKQTKKKLKKEIQIVISGKTKIKWKTKYKIKEIEKIKYITINDCESELKNFQNKLLNKFSLYMQADNTIEKNIEAIINNFNNIISGKNKIIDRQYKAILKIGKRSRISLVAGLTYSTNFSSNLKFGVGACFGYRIF